MFTLILVGFAVKKIGFMHPQTSSDLTNILLDIVSPCLIINAFEHPYSAARMHEFLLTAAAMLIFYLVAILLAAIIFSRVKPVQVRQIAKYGAVYSNAGLMGIPIASAVFGSTGVFFAVAALAGFNIFTWTHGASLFRPKSQKGGIDWRQILLNPNLLAVLIGLIFFLTSIKLPVIVNGVLKDISLLNAPLSMIVIGASLADIKLSRQMKSPVIWLAIILRNILFPLLSIFILKMLGVSGTAYLTSVVMMSCPAAALVVLFPLQYHSDVATGLAILGISTLLSLVTIPGIFLVATL